MSRLRRLSGLCSRILSDPANRLRKIRKKKSSAVPHILERSHIGNLRHTIQGKGVILKRVETAGVYPLVRPRGVSADSLASQVPTPDEHIIKIDKYPQKGYTNLTCGYGGIGRRARFRFWCPRRAGSSPVTRTNKKRCGISPQRFSFAYFYLDSLLCAFCSKRSFATIAR